MGYLQLMENYFETFCRTVSRISFVFQGNKLVEPSYRLFGKGGFEQYVVNCVSSIVQAYVGKELVGMGKMHCLVVNYSWYYFAMNDYVYVCGKMHCSLVGMGLSFLVCIWEGAACLQVTILLKMEVNENWNGLLVFLKKYFIPFIFWFFHNFDTKEIHQNAIIVAIPIRTLNSLNKPSK